MSYPYGQQQAANPHAQPQPPRQPQSAQQQFQPQQQQPPPQHPQQVQPPHNQHHDRSICTNCGTALWHPPDVPAVKCYDCGRVTNLQGFKSTESCHLCGTWNNYSRGDRAIRCYVCHGVSVVPVPPPEELIAEVIRTAGISRLDAQDVLAIHYVTNGNYDVGSNVTDVVQRTRATRVGMSGKQFLEQAALSKSTQNFDAVECAIKAIFSNPFSLNRSFLSTEGIAATHHTSGLNLLELRQCLAAILSMPTTVHQSLIHAIRCLLGTWDIRPTEPEHLRQYQILMEVPLLARAEYCGDLLGRLFSRVASLPPRLSDHLIAWWSRFSTRDVDFFRAQISLVQQFLTCRLFSGNVRDMHSDACVISAVKVLGFTNAANQVNRLMSYADFYNDPICQTIDIEKDYKMWTNGSSLYSFAQHPYVLSIAMKTHVLHLDAAAQMTRELQEAFLNRLYRGVASSPFLFLKIRRQFIIDDTLSQISGRTLELKKKLRIEFVGEEGIDAGGVQKEFFQVMVQEIIDPKFGMFTYDEDTRLFWFNRNSLESETEFELIGKVIGLAIYNGVILNLNFPFIVYKKLLGWRPVYSDLHEVNPDLAKGLRQLLEYTEDDVEDVFCLDFSVSFKYFGELRTHELKEGGSNIPVTNDNRREYVDLYLRYALELSVQRQFAAFLRGFMMVCGGVALQLLRPEELELLVCGSSEIDIEDLEKATQYQGYTAQSNIIRMFWKVIRAMTTEELRKFLAFTTGSDRVPYKGVGKIFLIITRSGPDSGRLPVSHTCFNQLMLPEFRTQEKLQERLLLAVNNASGFGIK